MKHRETGLLLTLVCVAVLVDGAGCTVGSGKGYVSGEVLIPDFKIDEKDFDLKIDTFMAAYENKQLRIILQRGGDLNVFSDGVFILVRDIDKIKEKLDTPIEMVMFPTYEEYLDAGLEGDPPVPDPLLPVAVNLYLNRTCPDNHLGLTASEGSITFSSIFVPGEVDRIAGEFDFVFLDSREWKSPEEPGPKAHLHGRFDFKYSRGQPAQPFP